MFVLLQPLAAIIPFVKDAGIVGPQDHLTSLPPQTPHPPQPLTLRHIPNLKKKRRKNNDVKKKKKKQEKEKGRRDMVFTFYTAHHNNTKTDRRTSASSKKKQITQRTQ